MKQRKQRVCLTRAPNKLDSVAVEFDETTVEESAVSEEEKAVAEGTGVLLEWRHKNNFS